MDSPVRQYQKQKDYRRHKLFRKINRRRKAERQQAIDAPMKELRRKLKRYKDGKDEKKELPYPLRTSSDYNDNLAYQSDIVRDPKTGHMWSTTQEPYPQERTYLKSPSHPTYGPAIWGDMAGGYQVYRRGNKDYAAPNFGELMYTKAPFKYKGGKDDWLHSQLKTYWGGELPEVVVTARDLRKAQTFAGRIAQSIGASPKVTRGIDLLSTGVQLTPYGYIPAAADLGMDLNSLYHGDQHAEKDAVLDLMSMIPGVSKLGLKKTPTKTPKQMWDEALQMYRGDIKILQGIGRGADAVDDTWGAGNIIAMNNGKDSGIHIKPENRGKFTALKKRTGKSASWFKAHGTPAQKKMATFALNSRHWSKKR